MIPVRIYPVTFGSFILLVILVERKPRKSIKATEIITVATGDNPEIYSAKFSPPILNFTVILLGYYSTLTFYFQAFKILNLRSELNLTFSLVYLL